MKKYLLEHYPTLWNTRFVWMLPLVLLANLFFFVLGYVLLTDEAMGKYSYYGWGENYAILPFLLNLIISVLLLVGWLIHLFRNNAFQHFYPISCRQLFGQFVLYFLIVLGAISFYISFVAGESAKVHWRYSDSYISEVLRQYPKDFDTDNQFPYSLSKPQRQEYNIANNAQRMKQKSFVESEDDEVVGLVITAFMLSMLLFTVRITSLRTVLFTIVFAGVLSLLLTFLIMVVLSVFDIRGYTQGYIALGIFLIAYLSVLVLSVTLRRYKLYKGILMNTALLLFFPVLFIVLIFVLDRLRDYEEIFEMYVSQISTGWNLVLAFTFIASFVFTAFYTKAIRHWKALPE